MNTRRVVPLSAAMVSALLIGCASLESPESIATAKLESTRGNTVSGEIRFAQMSSGVRVSGQVSGLKPNAEFGFHVHEKGDCSSGDGMSTAGHFNPDGKPHAQHGHAGGHHAGDLPSLKSDASGVAKIDFTTGGISLGKGANSVLDRGLIVHRDPDDYKTQPTGNSGPRSACAVIRKV